MAIDLRSGGASTGGSQLDREMAGLDALEQVQGGRTTVAGRVWKGLWPKLAAVGLALVVWQAVVWSGWKPEYLLPGPVTAFEALVELVGTGEFWQSVGGTIRRALVGYGIALVLGVVVGLGVARFGILRRAVGSLITGLQTMPSVAWVPLAIILFQLGESAILFVVVLGAAPSIANGVIVGIDHVPPVLLRAGRVLGARGFSAYRHVVLPAALPSFVGGMAQGWAFAWRSLMAGELIAPTAGSGIGAALQNARDVADYDGVIATMIVIFVLGVVAAGLFSGADRKLRARWGLTATAG